MEKVRSLLESIRSTEEVTYDKDHEVILLNPIPDTKPVDYCYEMFAPLSDDLIREMLVENYREPFPKALQEFYKLSNGMFLFGRTVAIFGVPE